MSDEISAISGRSSNRAKILEQLAANQNSYFMNQQQAQNQAVAPIKNDNSSEETSAVGAAGTNVMTMIAGNNNVTQVAQINQSEQGAAQGNGGFAPKDGLSLSLGAMMQLSQMQQQ